MCMWHMRQRSELVERSENALEDLLEGDETLAVVEVDED